MVVPPYVCLLRRTTTALIRKLFLYEIITPFGYTECAVRTFTWSTSDASAIVSDIFGKVREAVPFHVCGNILVCKHPTLQCRVQENFHPRPAPRLLPHRRRRSGASQRYTARRYTYTDF